METYAVRRYPLSYYKNRFYLNHSPAWADDDLRGGWMAVVLRLYVDSQKKTLPLSRRYLLRAKTNGMGRKFFMEVRPEDVPYPVHFPVRIEIGDILEFGYRSRRYRERPTLRTYALVLDISLGFMTVAEVSPEVADPLGELVKLGDQGGPPDFKPE